MNIPTAIAIFAHPDDIEFRAAGTLLLLKQAGYRTHYLNLASGNCGSFRTDSEDTISIREREARYAARILQATHHTSLCHDLEIVYQIPLVRRLAAIIRSVNPSIVLTHSPQDYMEDHSETSRLAVTASFAKNIPNFSSDPTHSAIPGDITVYHATPHGLRDPLRQLVPSGLYVNTASVHDTKRQALAAHHSQKSWLDSSQGMGSYLATLDDESKQLGRMSGQFEHAEGWRRHLHLGLATSDQDPLADALSENAWVDEAYETSLGGFGSRRPVTLRVLNEDEDR